MGSHLLVGWKEVSSLLLFCHRVLQTAINRYSHTHEKPFYGPTFDGVSEAKRGAKNSRVRRIPMLYINARTFIRIFNREKPH